MSIKTIYRTETHIQKIFTEHAIRLLLSHRNKLSMYWFVFSIKYFEYNEGFRRITTIILRQS